MQGNSYAVARSSFLCGSATMSDTKSWCAWYCAACRLCRRSHSLGAESRGLQVRRALKMAKPAYRNETIVVTGGDQAVVGNVGNGVDGLAVRNGTEVEGSRPRIFSHIYLCACGLR